MSSVNQAAFVPGTTAYRFGYDSIANIPITGAPSDTNCRRWAMLHDGSAYRMYAFKGSTNNKIYQFSWNGKSYAYGHNSIPELSLTNIPADADASSFSMVHSGKLYHLYLRRLGDPTTLYQFLYVPGTTNYKYGQPPAIATLKISGFLADTDWARWMMLHDGAAFRLYAFKLGSNTQFYQGAWNGSSYAYGHASIPVLTLEGTPANSNLRSAAMLHDGSAYRLYVQTY
ncbi:hypothetical protein [Enhygromyxa salina]|uniref:Uncharacterized protein n=1 Tax=Enhygromyxa salina TaxID=215803 RepID=A0A2S9YTX0_9BACT|nr:hypothetical protein [Enhygromyxa salina]PRQ08561.1 hypothetical protein ENSA7_18470 [Enhygromyxa salina]